MVECLTRDRDVAGLIASETLPCVLEQDTIHSLVLLLPRKTRPDITEKVLTGMLKVKTYNQLNNNEHSCLNFNAKFCIEVQT